MLPKAHFFKICTIFILCLTQPLVSFAAYKIQPQILAEVKQFSYGAGLVKFCPLLSPTDYVSFTQDLLMAERLVNFEHASEYKFIFNDQEIKAKTITAGGKSCTDDVLDTIISAEILMKKFIATSPLRDELVIAHPQQPKLNQAFIFAGFLQARLAWVYQRKCHILEDEALDTFNNLLLKTQTEIELVFRPEQATMLNARIDERKYASIIDNCKPALSFIEHAQELMIDDLPNALEILKRF